MVLQISRRWLFLANDLWKLIWTKLRSWQFDKEHFYTFKLSPESREFKVNIKLKPLNLRHFLIHTKRQKSKFGRQRTEKEACGSWLQTADSRRGAKG